MILGARAEAVKERGIPPIEGEARRSFIESAQRDFVDYHLDKEHPGQAIGNGGAAHAGKPAAVAARSEREARARDRHAPDGSSP